MAIIKHQSRTRTRTSSGSTVSFSYLGTKTEMEDLASGHTLGEIGADGKLTKVLVRQDSGPQWVCEMEYSTGDSEGNTVQEPSKAWGKKSAQLHGSMLSLPLEKHPDYKAVWNHYLFGAPGVSSPFSGAASAASTALSDEQSQSYAWGKEISEAPAEQSSGKRWHVLLSPTKGGVESYDVAVYSVVETARFTSAAQAGKMVKGKLNQIGTPDNTFGITGGNWKCDDASVSYNGECWLATLTWTLSGDSSGWDQDLYGG